MLIYLGANIVQYCADESDFIFGKTERFGMNDPNSQEELIALPCSLSKMRCTQALQFREDLRKRYHLGSGSFRHGIRG